MIWGTRRKQIIDKAKAAGAEVCVLERGYLGDRMSYTSVSFGGGLNGRGIFRLPWSTDWPMTTRQAYRWKEIGGDFQRDLYDAAGHVLVCGQVPGDMAVEGIDIEAWAQAAQVKARAAYPGASIVYRPHPQASRRVSGSPYPLPPLLEHLRGARACITYNSNSGVLAVMAGIPTVATDAGSMAWYVASHAIDGKHTWCNRLEWVRALAWKQFSLEEMRSGLCALSVGL